MPTVARGPVQRRSTVVKYPPPRRRHGAGTSSEALVAMMLATQGLRVSTRRTSVAGPKVVTRAAIARQSRSGGTSNVTSIEPQPKKQRRPRQPKKKVEHVADEVVADEVLTPDWEARGARADQGRGPSQSRDVEVDQLDVPDRHDVQAVVPYPQAG